MEVARGNILIRLVKGTPEDTKRIKFRMVKGELALYLAKTKIFIDEKVLKEWNDKGWFIETDDVKRTSGMLRTISNGYLLIEVKEAELDDA